jgi:hypothetical protein
MVILLIAGRSAQAGSVALGVAAFLIGAQRVEVGAEPVFTAFEDLDIACVVLAVDDVAFRGDGVTGAGVHQLQQIGNGRLLVRVEGVKSVANCVDLLVAHRFDRRCSVGKLIIPTLAGNEVTSIRGGDDGHGVGVAKHPGATGRLDGMFEKGEHEVGGAGDTGRDG